MLKLSLLVFLKRTTMPAMLAALVELYLVFHLPSVSATSARTAEDIYAARLLRLETDDHAEVVQLHDHNEISGRKQRGESDFRAHSSGESESPKKDEKRTSGSDPRGAAHSSSSTAVPPFPVEVRFSHSVSPGTGKTAMDRKKTASTGTSLPSSTEHQGNSKSQGHDRHQHHIQDRKIDVHVGSRTYRNLHRVPHGPWAEDSKHRTVAADGSVTVTDPRKAQSDGSSEYAFYRSAEGHRAVVHQGVLKKAMVHDGPGGFVEIFAKDHFYHEHNHLFDHEHVLGSGLEKGKNVHSLLEGRATHTNDEELRDNDHKKDKNLQTADGGKIQRDRKSKSSTAAQLVHADTVWDGRLHNDPDVGHGQISFLDLANSTTAAKERKFSEPTTLFMRRFTFAFPRHPGKMKPQHLVSLSQKKTKINRFGYGEGRKISNKVKATATTKTKSTTTLYSTAPTNISQVNLTGQVLVVENDVVALHNGFGAGVAAGTDGGVSSPEAYTAAASLHGDGDCYPGDDKMHEVHVDVIGDPALNHFAFRDKPSTTHHEMAVMVWQSSFVYENQFHVMVRVKDSTVLTPHKEGDTDPVHGCPKTPEGNTDVKKDWVYQKLLGMTGAQLGPKADSTAIAVHMFSFCQQKTQILGLAFKNKACTSAAVGINRFAEPTWHTFVHELAHNLNGDHPEDDGGVATENAGLMGYGDGRFDGVYQFKEPNRGKICDYFKKFATATSGTRTHKCMRQFERTDQTKCDRVSYLCGADANCQPYHERCEVGQMFWPKVCTGTGTTCVPPETDFAKVCDQKYDTYFVSDGTFPQVLFLDLGDNVPKMDKVDLYGVLTDHFPRMWKLFGCPTAVNPAIPNCPKEQLVYEHTGYVESIAHNYYYRDYRSSLGAPQGFSLQPMDQAYRYFRLVIEDSNVVTDMEKDKKKFAEPYEKYPTCTGSAEVKMDSMNRKDQIILAGIRFRNTQDNLDASLPPCDVTAWSDWSECSSAQCDGIEERTRDTLDVAAGGGECIKIATTSERRRCSPACPWNDPYISPVTDEDAQNDDNALTAWVSVFGIPGWDQLTQEEKTTAVVLFILLVVLALSVCHRRHARHRAAMEHLRTAAIKGNYRAHHTGDKPLSDTEDEASPAKRRKKNGRRRKKKPKREGEASEYEEESGEDEGEGYDEAEDGQQYTAEEWAAWEAEQAGQGD
ncbi:unnamed protein product [Amoebophrya sp. A120]|nr:unnamed protein product [Amoebophrya sp. A120]|eukprot:GSA120T00003054001.1